MYAIGNNTFFEEMTMIAMTFGNTVRAAGAVLVVAALLGGCQKKDEGVGAGPAETAGRKIDQASERAGQELNQASRQASEQMSEAAKDTSQKLDRAAGEASQKFNEATEKAGRKLEQAGEKMQQKAAEREAAK
jgi:vacuolar-type H+-ATPase subunit H